MGEAHEENPDRGESPDSRAHFTDLYRSAEAKWDTGRPQPFVFQLLADGFFQGRVADLGCGTGANAIAMAKHGLDVHGFDFVTDAVLRARERMAGRDLPVTFSVWDLQDPVLPVPEGSFDGVVDSAVFHVFEDEERPAYVEAARRLLRPGGRFALVCFSDREPGDWGPRRICREELERTFAEAFAIEGIQECGYDHLEGTARGWLLKAARR